MYHSHSEYVYHVIRDPAGVMYWGDTSNGKIATAYLNGTGGRTLLTETGALYYAFVLDDGNIYFTDWRYGYAYYFACLCCLISIYRLIQ